jgi:hypothetical protein
VVEAEAVAAAPEFVKSINIDDVKNHAPHQDQRRSVGWAMRLR